MSTRFGSAGASVLVRRCRTCCQHPTVVIVRIPANRVARQLSSAAPHWQPHHQGTPTGQVPHRTQAAPPASRVIVITSGKGGVGKTTTAASIAYGLASSGYKTCVIDFDIGLRNLDIHLGMERRVVFDFIHVIQRDCRLQQALIQHKQNPNLYLLAASLTKDKEALTLEGVTRVIQELGQTFHFVLCDSPAGIESGARHAMYLADEAIIVTNPELSSCRDSDKMVGFIASRSRRAERGETPVRQTMLITRYDAERARENHMLSVDDVQELLGLKVLGVIPESRAVLSATNVGQPVIEVEGDDAAEAYRDAVARLLGDTERPLKFLEPKPQGLLARWFKKN